MSEKKQIAFYYNSVMAPEETAVRRFRNKVLRARRTEHRLKSSW